MGESHVAVRRRLLPALVAMAVLGTTVAVATAAPAAAACAAGSLQPVLREVTVNQGTGQYPVLARDKETLVRVYLGMPQCADAANQIEVRGGSLSVSVPGGATTVVQPASPPVSPFDQVTAFGVASPADDAADLVFAVPAAALDTTVADSVQATFSVQILYAARNRKTEAWTPAAGLPGAPVSFPSAATRTIGARTNSLGVLVVPLVDRSGNLDAQWPTTTNGAAAAIQRGMLAASRILPIRDGVEAALGATSGAGLRYQLLDAASGVDVGSNGLGMVAPGGKLCVTGSNFRFLRPALAAALQTWNAENPDAQADRVVGAGWEGFTLGSASSCMEGLSPVPGAEVYVRALSDSATAPSMTGSLLAHELYHSFGGVPTSRGDAGYHALSTAADATFPNRTFNVSTRRVLGGTNRNLMRLSSGWNENTTVFDAAEYEVARCLLAPVPGVTCDGAASGSIGSALAGPAWVLYGRTDGTPAGTEILNSYTDGDVDRTDAQPGSAYHVVQRNAGGAVVQDTPIPTSAVEPDDDLSPGPASTAPAVTIDVAVPLHGEATSFALLNGSTVLYSRTASAAPVFASIRQPLLVGSEVNHTAAPGADGQPSLAPDGRRLAWTTAVGVRAQQFGVAASAPVAGTEPALSGDDRIAYVTPGGGVAVASVTVAGSSTSIGTPATVYQGSLLGIAGLVPAPASHPSWTPDGDLVVAIAGDLWRLEIAAPGLTPDPVTCSLLASLTQGCARITTTSAVESHPSVAGDGSIAYQVGANEVWRSAADGSGATRLVTDASQPAAIVGAVAVVRSGAVWFVDGSGMQPIGTGPQDSRPSLSADGRTLALDRQLPDGTDVFLLSLEPGPTTVTVVDDRPDEVRLDVLQRRGGLVVPLRLSLRPTSTTATSATFTLPDLAPYASDGNLVFRASDGINTTRTEEPGPGPQANQAPVVALYAPPRVLFEGDAIPVSSEARDTEDGDLAAVYRLSGPGLDRIIAPSELPDVVPPDGGWTPGQYELRAMATDSQGASGSDSRTFTIVEDADHDHVAAAQDVRCNGESSDDDAASSNEDDDGDGIANGVDPAPCVANVNAVVDFDPNTLHLGSSGTPVTTYVTCSTCNLRSASASTVRIVSIGGYPTSMPALSWSASSRTQAAAQFDRQALIQFITDPDHPGLIGRYVPIVIEGTAGTTVFRGFDPTAPYVNS